MADGLQAFKSMKARRQSVILDVIQRAAGAQPGAAAAQHARAPAST